MKIRRRQQISLLPALIMATIEKIMPQNVAHVRRFWTIPRNQLAMVWNAAGGIFWGHVANSLSHQDCLIDRSVTVCLGSMWYRPCLKQTSARLNFWTCVRCWRFGKYWHPTTIAVQGWMEGCSWFCWCDQSRYTFVWLVLGFQCWTCSRKFFSKGVLKCLFLYTSSKCSCFGVSESTTCQIRNQS